MPATLMPGPKYRTPKSVAVYHLLFAFARQGSVEMFPSASDSAISETNWRVRICCRAKRYLNRRIKSGNKRS